jgi:UDP-N-acetylglucosamine 1-carboxyvinyltransferase
MSKFIIQGGESLRGEVQVHGMKNAATPIIAATLLTRDQCIINNLPHISDVRKMVEILESFGAETEWLDQHRLSICCRNVSPGKIDQKKVKAMRSSVLLWGPLISRFHELKITEPGGCIIGKRPLDTHFYVLKSLGCDIVTENENFEFKCNKLKGANVVLPEFSVTATENAIMAACLAEGETRINLAAAEPHVQDLIDFLIKMGAKIKGRGTHELIIEGIKELRGATHDLIPDQIEIGTWAVAGVVTRGEIDIYPIVPEHLEVVLLKFKEAGANVEIKKDRLLVRPSSKLRAFKIQSMPYPGFPTDLEAPFGVLATQCVGTSMIHDPLYEGRMGYVNELQKMGANTVICDPHRVLFTGPAPLYGREIRGYDLRAGATLIIAGLIAQGETTINEAEVVDRGYEKIEQMLSSLGANITRLD